MSFTGYVDLGAMQIPLAGNPATRTAYWDLGAVQVAASGGSGGGQPPGGTNPPTQTVATAFPLIFLELKVGATKTAYAETYLADDSDYFSGPKAAKILKVSPIRRELSRDGGFKTSTWRVELADHDRSFRTAAAQSTIGNSYCAIYVVDDATRRAKGTPFRIAAGVVVEHRALAGFKYELVIEDVLGTRFADVFRQPQIPPHVLSQAEYLSNPQLEGHAGPIAFGRLSDEAASSPTGVVPALFIGAVNLTVLHSLAVNTVVDAYLFCEHAVSNLLNLYYNEPSSLNNPNRYVVPAGAYGSIVWAPYKPNWSATGWTVNYVDYGGRRYTPMFIPASLAVAADVRDGKVIVSANIHGAEENGDGTGNFFDAPERLIQHLLVNYVFTSYATGSYAPVPFFPANSYTILDTSTVAEAAFVSSTRINSGYVSGVLLGADGQQTTGFDIIRDLLQGADLDMGINRHGQIVLSRENTSATPAVSFTAKHDILDGEFDTWIDHQLYANKLTYNYEPRYLSPNAPLPTPSFGQSLPKDPLKEFRPWVSSMVTYTATSSFGREVNFHLDNHVTRDSSTAASVGSFTLGRLVGPSGDGSHRFRLTTGWQGLGKGSAVVELGTVIQVEHVERIGTDGSSPFIGRVTAMEVDPQRGRVTLEGRVLR